MQHDRGPLMADIAASALSANVAAGESVPWSTTHT